MNHQLLLAEARSLRSTAGSVRRCSYGIIPLELSIIDPITV